MDTSAQIRDAAMRLFARDGFNGTPLQAVADEVGITKQTLLYYYPSKEELRRAVLGQLIEHWRQTLPRLLEAVTSGSGRFEALTGELVRFYHTDPDRARLILREMLDRPDDMRALLVEGLRPWLLLVAEYIRQGQESGILYEDVDPESYVMHVIMLVATTVANLEVLPRVLSEGRAKDGSAGEARYLAELFRIAKNSLFKPRKRTAKHSVAAATIEGEHRR
ncbi:MAG TPA: TetR family transcriptional regulator [Polyangiaceae bacterium]|jgi:AcrR family transcriptional regulator|nr:TetR family transcriptional regulator [Polyangiaceae bacterium]